MSSLPNTATTDSTSPASGPNISSVPSSDSFEQNVVPNADSSNGSGAGQLRNEAPEAGCSVDSTPANATANANEAGRPSLDIPLAVPAVAEELNNAQPAVLPQAVAVDEGPAGIMLLPGLPEHPPDNPNALNYLPREEVLMVQAENLCNVMAELNDLVSVFRARGFPPRPPNT